MAVYDRMDILRDASFALPMAFRSSGRHLLRSWLYVPFGITVILAICFGVDQLFQLSSLPFPPSVACLIVLFFGLLASEQLLGEHRTRKFVSLVEVPGDWSLRWINVFFTPSFVLLPLSPPIGIVEVFKIIAVFLIGFLITMVATAYMTRGLQLVLGSSKRAIIERAEELEDHNDNIPMTATSRSEGQPTPMTLSATPSSAQIDVDFQPPPPVQDIPVRLGHETPPEAIAAAAAPPGSPGDTTNHHPPSPPRLPPSLPAQAPPPPPRSQKWAILISSHLDLLTYLVLFLFVGIPIYYTVGYPMPLQLSYSILTYFGAASLPPRWKQYLHPVLVSSLFTVLGLWVLGLANGDDLGKTLRSYRTGARYSDLWDPTPSSSSSLNPLPGAGDMFSSVLDASIVALALPMYKYRRELRQHFVSIVTPNVVVSIASLFAYPYVCFAVGITAERSLAFAARSLTLALATPAVANLGGDTNTVAALAIMSGIFGVLIGRWFLNLLRIPEDDYVTRGVTLGANSSAIATAMLLPIDPRAAALSSLAMGLFGTVTVLFTSIPPISSAVRSVVGL